MRSFIGLLLATVLVSCFWTDCNAANEPSVYVEVHFSFSWKEFCSLEYYFKQSVSQQIVENDNTGRMLPVDKIVLVNFGQHCPGGSYKEAVVHLFVSKKAGSTNVTDIDKEMTIKVYKVLHYLQENKQERYLGSLFVGKIKGIKVAGKDAPPKSTAYTELERLYIGISVGLAIIVLIFLISLIVMVCKNKNKKKNNSERYESAGRNADKTVRTYPEEKRHNSAFQPEGDEVQVHKDEHPDHRVSTRL